MLSRDKKIILWDKTNVLLLTSSYANSIIIVEIVMENLSKKEQIVLLIKFIDKEFKKDFEKRLSEYGLTAQQGRLLFYINYKTKTGVNVRQVDIEKHYQLTKSTVSGLIARMEKADLIIKKKENGHQYIVISEKTESIISHILDNRTKCLDVTLQGLTKEEIDTLYDLLMKVQISKGGND